MAKPTAAPAAPAATWVHVSNVTPWDANPYDHPEAQVETLADSIEEYGWGRPALVWLPPGEVFDPLADHRLIAGHGARQGFLRLCERNGGSFRVKGSPAADTVLVRPMALSEGQAAGLALIDNESDTLRARDESAVARLLASMGQAEALALPTGLDDDSTMRLLAMLGSPGEATIREPAQGSTEAPGAKRLLELTDDVAVSQVRMVQLFLDTDTHPGFIADTVALKAEWGADLSLTDVVLRAVREAAES